MTDHEFQIVLDNVLIKIQDVLGTKADEYATHDALHNFKQAAHLTQSSPEEALAGMMAKHTVSIYDMISNGGRFSMEKWDEKIIDNINYLILLKAIMVEKENAKD